MTRYASETGVPIERSRETTGLSHPDGLSVLEATHYGPMEPNGGYPRGFLDWLYPAMGVEEPDQVIHLCSGSIRRGVRVDIRPEMDPTILADCRNTGIAANSVKWIVADPPPMPIYNELIYGIPSAFPKSEEILAEAARILIPGGRVAILCFVKPQEPFKLALTGTYAVMVAEPLVIRGLFIYEKVDIGVAVAHVS